MNNSNIDHQKSGNLSTDELTSSSTSTINEVRGKSFKYFNTIVLACTVIFLICQIIVYLGFREHRKSIIDMYQISPSTQFMDSGTSFENIDSLISGLDIPCSQKIELQHSIKVVAGDISSTIKNNIELLDTMAVVEDEETEITEEPKEDDNVALLTKILANPDAATLLKALAKSL